MSTTVKCEICGKIYKSTTTYSFYKHLMEEHGLSQKEYYDNYVKKEGEGICKCCGKPTKFISAYLGYNKYCSKSCSSRHSAWSEENRLKRYNTNIKIYGGISPLSNEDVKEKSKNTCLSIYGETNPMKSSIIKDKMSKNYKEKHGVDWPTQDEKVKEKMKNTTLKNYNVDNCMKNKEIREKALETKRRNRPNDPTNSKKAHETAKLKRPEDPFNREKFCETMKNKGLMFDYKNYNRSDVLDYRRAVRHLTGIIYKKYKDIINPLDLHISKNDYSIDHKFSIFDGFNNNIPIKVMVSPLNLEIISLYKNKSKGTKSSISKENLFDNYEKFLKEYPDYESEIDKIYKEI